jgi:hypothetical protein
MKKQWTSIFYPPSMLAPPRLPTARGDTDVERSHHPDKSRLRQRYAGKGHRMSAAAVRTTARGVRGSRAPGPVLAPRKCEDRECHESQPPEAPDQLPGQAEFREPIRAPPPATAGRNQAHRIHPLFDARPAICGEEQCINADQEAR